MSNSADLIVIGGGLHGTSAALHAAKRGLKVIVLEKDHPARHASGVNAGGVRRLGRHPAEVPISVRSMEIWRNIGDLVDHDCGFKEAPQIKVAETGEHVTRIRERVALLNRMGYTHETELDQKQLREALPAVSDHCQGGLKSDDGFAQPFVTTTAFVRKARSLGVKIHEQRRVTDIRKTGSHWQVTAGGQRFTAEKVLNCAGAWGGEIAEKFGDSAPVGGMAPMMIVTQRMPHFCDAVVGAYRPLSFKQMPNGTVVIGGGRLGYLDRTRNRSDILFGELRHSAETAIAIFPIMRHAVIQRTWSGVEGLMPDEIPVIGRSPRHDSVFHAFGFSGHGFQLGPAVGELMAELIATGHTDAPLEPFAITRFSQDPGKPETDPSQSDSNDGLQPAAV